MKRRRVFRTVKAWEPWGLTVKRLGGLPGVFSWNWEARIEVGLEPRFPGQSQASASGVRKP